jgi:hypothetical protein
MQLRTIQWEKDVSDKKIEIEVPEDYELVQDGMNIKFVKSDKRFLSWEEKDSGLNGYYIDVASGVYTAGNCPRPFSHFFLFLFIS